MSKKVDSMWKAIELMKALPGTIRYSMNCGEIIALNKSGGQFEIIVNAFDYGFIKGMRYQKAQEKKRKAAEA